MKIYDYIIVGSGLTAASSLIGIKSKKKKVTIANISPQMKSSFNENLHQWIYYQNNIQKLNCGFENSLSKYFHPQIITNGGYAVFWGQQIHNDLNVLKKILKQKNKKNLNFLSSKINFLLQLKKGEILSEKKIQIKNKTHKLKICKPDQAITGKKTIKVFKKFFDQNTKVYNQNAKIISGNKVYFENGDYIEGKKIILACGLFGVIKIIRNSLNLSEFKFKDHQVILDVAYGDLKFPKKKDKNICTHVVEVLDRLGTSTYLKVYPLINIPIGLIFRFFNLNFFYRNFKNLIKSSIRLNNFYIIQRWHPDSYRQNFSNGKISKNFIEDKGIEALYRSSGLKKIVSFNKNYSSFHYYDLKFRCNRQYISVNKLLNLKFRNKVICPGSLSLDKTTSKPPSFVGAIWAAIQCKIF